MLAFAPVSEPWIVSALPWLVLLGAVFNLTCFVLLVIWMLRILGLLEKIARSSGEGREYTRLLGVEVGDIKRRLLS